MRYVVGLVAVGLLAGSGLTQDEATKKEMKLLEGTWTVESAQRDGKDYDRIKGDQLIFEGDRLTLKMKDRDQKITYKLDVSKKPRAIDITPEGKDKTIPAIYELKGDTLKLCFAEPDTERPTEFKSDEGSRRVLVILKRAKS
ncbi:MAG: TIGR03067 domain-containing protein [Gemmataceae bacterium]|nr:TIGR03067 domain-containing protein [Gemmataceae bacterium]